MTHMFKMANPPPPPTPIAPTPMPDPMNPQAMAARQKAMASAASGGRASTMMTGAAPLAAGGAYGGTKTGG